MYDISSQAGKDALAVNVASPVAKEVDNKQKLKSTFWPKNISMPEVERSLLWYQLELEFNDRDRWTDHSCTLRDSCI